MYFCPFLNFFCAGFTKDLYLAGSALENLLIGLPFDKLTDAVAASSRVFTPVIFPLVMLAGSAPMNSTTTGLPLCAAFSSTFFITSGDGGFETSKITLVEGSLVNAAIP